MSGAPFEQLRTTGEIFEGLPLLMKVGLVLSRYAGWHYAQTDADVRFAFPSHGLPASRVLHGGEGQISCSPLTLALVFSCWPTRDWDDQDYGDLIIYADRLPGMPDSPMRAVERRRIGRRLGESESWVVGALHLVQGWSELITKGDKRNRGHAVWVLARQNDVVVFESTIRKDPTGQSIGVRITTETYAQFAARFPRALYRAVLHG